MSSVGEVGVQIRHSQEQMQILRLERRVSVWRELHLLSRDARYPTFSCLFALTDSGCALFSQRDQDAHSPQSLVLHFSLVDRSYVYYFFNFLSMNRLAECIKKGNFYIPERHIDKLNEAYDRSSGCVYIFVSSQSSKLIHV